MCFKERKSKQLVLVCLVGKIIGNGKDTQCGQKKGPIGKMKGGRVWEGRHSHWRQQPNTLSNWNLVVPSTAGGLKKTFFNNLNLGQCSVIAINASWPKLNFLKFKLSNSKLAVPPPVNSGKFELPLNNNWKTPLGISQCQGQNQRLVVFLLRWGGLTRSFEAL